MALIRARSNLGQFNEASNAVAACSGPPAAKYSSAARSCASRLPGSPINTRSRSLRESLYGEEGGDETLIETLGDGLADDDIDQLRDLASEAPVIRMVNLIISRAVESRAISSGVRPPTRQIPGQAC